NLFNDFCPDHAALSNPAAQSILACFYSSIGSRKCSTYCYKLPKASTCAEALAEMLKPYLPESTLTESGLTELFGSESEL
ncbi:hypothetical protein, partial [Pantanalinema sp. GBBB05]|uniref:hypothetical protein n=1 Tax=Pantanalinema sp. GBBB05 TaxID=2604139 RepID=UPI003D819CA5